VRSRTFRLPRPRRLAARLVGAATLALATACASTPDRGSPTLDRAESAYRRGDFETASRLAASVENSSQGGISEEAAYVHGLAAARAGRRAEARRAFEIAAGSLDRDLADRARRSLAALDGTASSAPASTAFGTGPVGFTVQAGAYGTEAAARSRAAELDAAARRAGYGPASVRRIGSSRGTLWAVQIGRFGDRLQAGRARDRLGHPEWAVEAIEGP